MTKPITKNVLISVKTSFSELQSNIEMNEYFFVYNITIQNNSDSVIQLMSRKWYITDSNGENRFVEGEGVVGEQPIIEPGNSYDYYSGCLLKTGLGKMSGSYYFLSHPDGISFEAPIPEFNLVLPWVLN